MNLITFFVVESSDRRSIWTFKNRNTEPFKSIFCSVSANVETMHMVIDGERIKIDEVNKPSHKFEVCFVKTIKAGFIHK